MPVGALRRSSKRTWLHRSYLPPCVHAFRDSSFSLAINDLALRLPASRETHTLPCWRESPSHPPGAKDHVSGILDPFAKRNSGEVVAENWNSVPHGRRSLLDRRACEMSVQRLVSVVCYSQQVSRVNAAMRGPSKEKEFGKRKPKRNGKTGGAFLASLSPPQW